MQTLAVFAYVSVLNEEEYEARLSVLPEPIRVRVKKNGAASLGAWTLFSRMMKELGVRDLRLSILPQGRPVLAGKGPMFSLSHSGDFALCCVGDGPLGADVERLRQPRRSLIRRALSEQERSWLSDQPEETAAFARLWTRKESLVKACSTGFDREPSQVQVCPGAPVFYRGADWFFSEQSFPGAAACVCTLAPEEVLWRQAEL